MTGTGKFRVYFNRHRTGRPWCIAKDAWEIEVASVFVDGIITAHYDADTPRTPDHLGPPSAWFEVEGFLAISDDGLATITRVLHA